MSLWNRLVRSLITVMLVLMLLPVSVSAAVGQSSSTNYSVDQVYFGSGGQLSACSTSYCSKQSAGSLNVGQECSTNYCAQAGNNTDRTEYLQFVVSTSSINAGVLNSGTTSTATAAFSVKSYLASGYSVVNASPGPQNGSHIMTSPTTPTASVAGSEQFGMNVVANTNPATFGANPVQVPNNTFSFGQAASGYNTPNLYKYSNGDTIASSNKSSGETDYTISYIFNISGTTPGGTYTMNHVLVATATF